MSNPPAASSAISFTPMKNSTATPTPTTPVAGPRIADLSSPSRAKAMMPMATGFTP